MNTATTVVTGSPVGPIGLEAHGESLVRVLLRPGPSSGASRPAGVLAEAVRQFDAYFAGRLERWDVPIAPSGTPFQLEVWRALREIPFGDTCSYRDLAHRIGRPAAVRAVGAANGRNPIPIVIPCHRVIGSDGTLVGFGGGLSMKRALLALEQRRLF
jgi:methylated-DNA-[protein]-cysteine S-methyltransferase